MSEPQDTNEAAGGRSDSTAVLGAWLPIETAPENTEMLCYCGAYEPHFFVARFKWESEYEDVLVSERGNRRTYETRETKVRNWGDSESYGAEFWMQLPEAPNIV